jgi:hypothetical protein
VNQRELETQISELETMLGSLTGSRYEYVFFFAPDMAFSPSIGLATTWLELYGVKTDQVIVSMYRNRPAKCPLVGFTTHTAPINHGWKILKEPLVDGANPVIHSWVNEGINDLYEEWKSTKD